jgi:hypothetical protein
VTKYSASADGPRALTPFRDLMEGWTNDDLLLNDNERKHFYRRHPRLAPIFDWPEMRQAFSIHEQPARQARRRSRRYGTMAVAFGFLGLALSAFTPWLAQLLSFSTLFPGPSDLVERWIGGAAAALIVLGTIVGAHQALIGQAKREWLVNRYWTERIRQFHFQLILNNLERAAAALGGGATLDAWRKLRQGKLADFLHDAKQRLPIALDELQDDHAEEDVWVDKSWRERPPMPPRSPELVELLEGLGGQRIGVQERYIALKLTPGLYSPQTRAEWLQGSSDVFTAGILLLTVAIGVIYIHGSEEPRLWLLGMLGGAGTLTAAVVALRVLNEGLLLRTEAERYRWYLASLRSIASRFEKADTTDRVPLMRELERLAYREMRRFLITSKEARFII